MDKLGSPEVIPVKQVQTLSDDDYYMIKLREELKKNVFTKVIENGKQVNVIPADIIDAVLSDANMKLYFMKAFTHKSFRYYNDSWEKLETRGDHIANMFVADRIDEVYPDATHDQLNKMIAYYKSNE